MELKHRDIIEQMTLEEKVSLLSGKNFWESQGIERLGIPSMFLSDGPHGIRKQAASADHLGLNESIKAVCYPTASAASCSWNLDLLEEVGVALGKEARYQDVNVLLGPGINVKRSPLCGRNFEYFSEDPYLAGKAGASLIRGIQSKGLSACVKHYACNSQELRRLSCSSVLDQRTLRELYLTNFEIAVKEGHPKSLMSSYNLINGVYANEEKTLLRDVLRNEWGFNGVVVSDWGGENDRVDGLIASNELEMPTSIGENNLLVKKAIEEGKLDPSYLDEAVDRLIELALTTSKVEKEDVDYELHHQIAQKAAEECMVLLENDGVLPLKNTDRVAFFGAFVKEARYQGAGSSQVNSYRVDNVLDHVEKCNFEYAGYSKGFDFSGKIKKGLVKKALKVAEEADVLVVYAGLDSFSESEGIDRDNMKIPMNQIDFIHELVKTGKKVVVCLAGGSAMEIPFANKINGLLHMHLTGEASALASLRILTGEVNPSGKLSETLPLVDADAPTYNYWHKKTFTAEYREGLYIGYRYYDKNDLAVRYPFGYGLSYTTFEYSDLKIDEKGVIFTIKNTGKVKGKEVAQMYIGLKKSNIFRAKKELKGFVKVELEPGENKEVRIDFDDYSFRYYNIKTNKYEIEAGNYDVYIASSSRDIRLTGHIEKEGTASTVNIYKKNKLPSYFSGNISDVKDEEFEELIQTKIPESELVFIKKNRIVVTRQTTVQHLRYSRGWVGRFISWGIRAAIGFLRAFGDKKTANTLTMGMLHNPMRGFMMSGVFTWKQVDGIIEMANGKFFKGMGMLIKGGKKKEKKK